MNLPLKSKENANKKDRY